MGMFSSDEDCWNHRSNNPYEELVLVLTDIFNGREENLRKWLNETIERLNIERVNDEKQEERNKRLIEAIYTFNDVFCSRVENETKIRSDKFEHLIRNSVWARAHAFVAPQSYYYLIELIMYAMRYMECHGCKMTLIEVPAHFFSEMERECTYLSDKPVKGMYCCGVPVKVGRDYMVVVHWNRIDKTEGEKFWDTLKLVLENMSENP